MDRYLITIKYCKAFWTCWTLQKPVVRSHSAPWYTPELQPLKSEARRVEWLTRETGLTIHKDMYHNHLLKYKNTTSSAVYYASLIQPNENSHTLFSTCSNALQPSDIFPLMNSTTLCNKFMNLSFPQKFKRFTCNILPTQLVTNMLTA